MDLVDLIESRRFLGHEFLLWLWYTGEQSGGRFELPETGEVIVAFDDQLVLEAVLAEAERSRLSGGSPTDSPEARTALKSGKRVTRARMRLLQGDREWVFTVTAADFAFSSVRVPAVLKSEEERLLERITLIDELSEAWSKLFRQFLERRLSDDWTALEEALAEWMGRGA